MLLYISKPFDKVYNEGLILKLSCNDISGNLLNFLKEFKRLFKIPKTRGAVEW